MTPRTQKALLLKAPKSPFVLETINIPTPGPGEILVKVQATSLNPVDFKIQKDSAVVKHYPAVLGIDAAGDVEELGDGVTGVSVGDRVLVQRARVEIGAAHRPSDVGSSKHLWKPEIEGLLISSTLSQYQKMWPRYTCNRILSS